MEKRPTIRALTALALAGTALTGCANEPAPYTSGGTGPNGNHLWQDNAAQSVALTDELDAYQYAPNGSIPFERFEYARRDAELNAGRPGPLRASQEWPEPPRPQERRFRFRYWAQE